MKITVAAGTFMLMILLLSCSNNHLLKETRTITFYPSASGIEFYGNQLYVVGDDASQVIVLDTNLAVVDSIKLYQQTGKRIPKEIKPDLESIAKLSNGRHSKLLLLGSGSLIPYRNKAWLIDPGTGQKDSIQLDTFYQRLRYQGLGDINIEGSCAIPGYIVFSNRGHLANRKNFLVFTSYQFWNNQGAVPINPIRIGSNPDSSVFNGISGIAYASKSDRLLLTVSTENTQSVYEDGVIGKSYLWIVQNISSKRRWKSINPNQIIDLENVDRRFKGQKIESVCVIKETKHFLHLVLAADNDDGSSTIFKLLVEKN